MAPWHRILFVALVFTLTVFSCKKEEPPATQPPPASPTTPPVEFGNLEVVFEHVVDNEVLELGKKFLNPYGDTFTVSKFNYYITNLALVKENDSLFTQTNSYYLIEESKSASKQIGVGALPYGKYKSIRLLIGVDSARNVSGAQTGALDPANGMFWNWSTGYIMLKLEGTAPTSTVSGKIIEYHLGGFKGINKVQRLIEIAFSPSLLVVEKNKIPKLHLKVNLNELFTQPETITFSALPIITSAGANAKKMADNYQDMITFNGID